MLMVKFTVTVVCCLLSSIAMATEPLFPEVPGRASYTYQNEFVKDFPGTLNTIKSLGITDMEFSNLFGKTAVESDVALETGQLDIRAFIEAARKAGVEPYDIEDESPIIATQVPRLIAYLKGLVKD